MAYRSRRSNTTKNAADETLMNRLALAGIKPSPREISNFAKFNTSRTAMPTIGQTASRGDVFKKPLKQQPHERAEPCIRSLFSTASYSPRPIHTFTRELMPMVPGPWVKFRQLLTEYSKAGLPTSEALKKLEPGEIFERHKLSPNPLLSTIDGLAPHQAYRNRELYIYLHEVKRVYLLAKNKRRKWEMIRDRFRNDDFQAIVSDYLADCQMRRDRGEITDHESDRRCSSVLTFLFGEQLKVEKEFQLAEQELDSCCEFLVSLKENPAQPEELQRRLISIKNFNLRSHDAIDVPEKIPLLSSKPSNGIGRSSILRNADEPVENVFNTDKLDDGHHCFTVDSDGIFLLTTYEDRLRISRALDQRVPSQYRLFNGKATTFNEARTTRQGLTSNDNNSQVAKIATTGNNDKVSRDGNGNNIIPQKKACVLDGSITAGTSSSSRSSSSSNCSSSKCMRSRSSSSSISNNRTYSFEIELGQTTYNLQLASHGPLKASSRNNRFQQQKHLLWGCFPSAGRKKFAEEEVILSEDDSYIASRCYTKSRMSPSGGIHQRGSGRASTLKTLSRAK